MKKWFLLLSVLLVSFTLSAQTVVFHENFESPSGADSVTPGGTTYPWSVNARIYAQGVRCDSNFVQAGDTAFLTTASFNCSTYPNVILQFKHICKIELTDAGEIEVSVDGGTTWTKLTGTHYLNPGNSQFVSMGNKFNCITYVSPDVWQYGSATAKPQSSWFMTEQFDISAIAANQADVRVRFVLRDGTANGANFNHGWYIDDLQVLGSAGELIPPKITMKAPIVMDSVGYTGPFNIYATISDISGIDTAYVEYNVNGGSAQYVPMTLVSDSTYLGVIPSFTYGNRIEYKVHALDGSTTQNSAEGPLYWFYVKRPPMAIIIGTGTSTDEILPTNGYYNYSWGNMLYLASEIMHAGPIDSIGFYVGSVTAPYTMPNQKVWLGTTTATTVGTAMPDTSGMTLVFNGSFTFNGVGWASFKPAVTINYNGSSNLMLYWVNKDGDWDSGYPNFAYTPTTAYLATESHSDTYANVFPTSTGTNTYNRPNLRLLFPTVVVSGTEDAGVAEILAPEATSQANVNMPLEITIKNYGTDTLRKATIQWELDGVAQTDYVWTGILPEAVVSTAFTPGTFNVPMGSHTIKVWTALPNDSTDNANFNDTLSVSFYACDSLLNGSYTVGPTGDFTNFDDVMTSLYMCGINGPVVFNIQNGIYTDQMSFTEIPGASATNTVTFQSASGNADDVTLQYTATGTADNYVINLTGADNMRFRNMTIKNMGSGYGRIVTVGNASHNNIIEGNHLVAAAATASNVNTALIYSGGTVDTLNIIRNNVIENGSYGIYWYGTGSSTTEQKSYIQNNTLLNQYAYGIRAAYQNAIEISGNKISSTASAVYGIYLYYGFNGTKVLKNTVNLVNSGYGIYVYYSDGVYGDEIIVANNMISVAGTGTSYGIYDYYSSNVKFYYNSVNVFANNSTARALYVYGSSDVYSYFKNNILAYTGPNTSGMAAYISTTAMVAYMDYNDLYSTGTNLGYWGANRANLAAWRTASLKDSNSVSVNPQFLTPTNLHTFSPNIVDKGKPVAEVLDDIDGEVRSLTVPDIGADEFALSTYNVGVDSVAAPVNGCAHTTTTSVAVRVRNMGLSAASNIDVYYVMNGGTPVHEVIPGPLASGTTMIYTFTTTADLSAYGNYNFKFYVHLTGDSLAMNDTLTGYTVYSGYNFTGGAYTQGFEPTEYYADWKAFSVGPDTYTYEFPYNSATYAHSGANSARFYTASSNTTGDWLFSRCFPLEAGKTYKISFWYRAYSATYAQNITLKYGQGATPAAMTNTLATLTAVTSTTYQQSVSQFVAPASGSYNFGWYSNSANSGYHYIDDINISVVPEQEAALEKIHRPVEGCGLTSNEDVVVHIKNTGAMPIAGNLTAYYQVNGSTPVSEVVSATIATLDTLNYTFATKLNMAVAQDSTFDIAAWISLPGDPFTTNDSAFTSVDSYHVPVDPMVVNDTVIFGTYATLHAYAPDSVYWFASPVATNHFFMGQTYVTPQLFDTVTYYVAAKAGSGSANVGAPNTSIGSGGSGTTSWEMIFDVLNPSGVTIKSVDMYPMTTAGSAFTVIVENASGTQVASYSGVTTVPSGSMETVPINLTIPYGTGYSMYMSPNPGFYRNTDGSAYPYTIPGQISITGNGFDPDYYYWFYNWQIGSGSGCESNRLPVSAYVVIPPEDLAVLDILSPVDGCTFGTEPVSVTLTNNGYNTITNSFSLGYFIGGNPIPTVEVVTTDIAPGDTIVYTFTNPAVVPVTSGDSTFSIMVYGENTNDIYFVDDTVNGSFTLRYSPADPIAINDTVVYGSPATLEAQSPYTVNWFNLATGGTPVATGQYYNTPVLYGNETMYAQATNSIPGGVTIIGTGTSSTSYIPAYGLYDYGWSSTLFTAAELGFTGRIDSIGYYVASALTSPYTLYSQSVYMGVVPYTTFTNLYETNTSTFTHVFTGDITFSSQGWVKIPLQTPFVYDGTGSLEIAWKNNDGDYASGYPSFRYTATTGNMAKYDYDDGAMPTIEGTGTTSRPNIYFSHETQGCPSHIVPVYAVVTGQPDVDAGVVDILQPASPTSLGVKNIEVVIRNYGLDTLETAEIHWTMNGVLQTPFVWNGSLLTGEIDTTMIGTYDFVYQPYPGNNELVAWSESPNGLTDPMAANDSSSMEIDAHDPYNGTYYLGTATPDFPDFTTAATALKAWGVSGPVTILVETGTYVEQVVFDSIPGTSAVNTVTFRSISGENTDVILSFGGATSTNNYVLKLNNGNYMHFEDMTLKSTTTSSNGRVIELAGGSSYNYFEGNIIQGIISTSSSTAVIYSAAGADNFNRFIGNQILNGYYGVYFYGASANRKQGNQFIDNVVKGWYYYGIYTYYSDSVRIIGNQIEHGTNASTNYSLYLGYANNGARVERNKIKATSTGSTYGIYAYYNNQSTTVPTLIANNFISATGGTGTVYGLYLYYSNYIDAVFNSVNINGGSATGGRALYTYSSSNTHHNYLNNNLANTASGYAYYVNSASVVDLSDYNNLFTNGSVLAYYTSDAADLAALQATSGMDAASKSSAPAFVSTHDLHTSNIDLYHTGIPVAGVTTDIDLDPRHALTPCIGADEFVPPTVDAGIIKINTPVSPVGGGAQTIKVSLRNFGLDPLTSVTIGWSVDGVLGTPFAWSGSLNSGAVLDSIAIGSYTFSSGASEIMAWTSLPNATADPIAANDTAYKTVVACSGPLAGTYTIGPAAADFVDFSEATLALQYCGISAPVVFNVQSGIYNEHIAIRPVDGASATNTITFQSTSGVNTDVTLRYAASTSSDNYVVWLDSASYIRFRNMTIESTTGNSYGYVVVLNGGASYNNFENNILQSVASTSSSTAPVYSGSGASDSYNVFVNNQMKNGYYGAYMYGSSSVKKYGNKFIGNTITGAYYYGIYTYYNDTLEIRSNSIRNASNSSSFYGLYLYYANGGVLVDKNIIAGTNSSTFYGIYLNYSDGSATTPSIVRNNFVSQSMGTGTAYGIYSYYADYANIVNNSVNITGGSASGGRAFYLSSGSEVKVLNNNFVNAGAGYAYYISSTAAVTASDYNNLYSATTTFAYWGAGVANLAALQAASLKDSNSVSQDPVYISASDLHAVSPGINNVATPLAYVTEDIDGQPRSATTPDIGADEFTPLPKDLAATAFVQPAATFAPVGNSMNVVMKVRNLGADTLTSFTLCYKYAGAPLVTEAWTGVLAPSASVDHAFVMPFVAQNGINTLTAYTVLSGDGNIHNDTITKAFTGVPVLTVPDSTDFESGTSFYADGPAGLWEFGTPSSATIIGAHSPVTCWKTNLDGVYGDSQNEYLYTPYYSFTQVTGATLKFWHWYETESAYDGGKIEYNITGTTTWITLGYVGDPAATNWYTAIISGTPAFDGASAGWVHSTYDLGAIPAIVNATVPVQFRFKFFTDASGTYDGWAIDDFTISAPPLAKDAGVIAITEPAGTSITGSNVTLSVQIYNYGADSLQSVPVAYRVNNGAVTQATWSGTLMPGDTADFTFPTTFVSPAALYEICAFTKRAGDTYKFNDTTCVNITPTAAPFDAGITTLLSPTNTTIAGDSIPVIVRIRNFGSSALTSIPVGFSRNGVQLYSTTWTGNLAPGDSIEYTFPKKYVSPMAFYSLCAYSMLPGDAYTGNDQKCVYPEGVIGVEEYGAGGFMLWQNVPNPTTGLTSISYQVPEGGNVTFELRDLYGRLLMTNQQQVSAGQYTFEIDAAPLSTGVYYYSIIFNDKKLTRKMMVH